MNISKILEIREHSGAVYSIDFDGEYLYSASADKFVTRWDLETGSQDKFAIRFDDAVYAIKVFQHFLVAGLSSGAVHVFDLEQSREIKHIAQHVKAIFSIAYADRNRLLIIGDADGNLSVWNTSKWKQMLYLPFDCGKIRDISFNENEDNVALACQDGTIRILDLETYNEIKTFDAHSGGANTACFVGSDTLLSGGKDAYIRRWSMAKGEQKSVPAHNFAVYGIRPFGSGYFLTVSRDKTIKLWNNHLEVIQRLEARDGGHSHSVNDLCILKDHRFATCSDDRRIIVWQVSNEPQG